jgi:FtsX-like permease family
VVVGLLTMLAGTLWALREPLSVQLTLEERPRRASTAAIFGRVLIFVAAGLSIYRSRTSAEPADDVFVLAAPALVGLVVGQVAVWVVHVMSRASVGWSTERGLDVFLGVRRLARHGHSISALRLLVAATVTSAVAFSGFTAVDDWTEETARLRNGAPLQIPIDAGALGVLSLTRQLDPDGEWLMAAVVVDDLGTDADRRVFLDTARYDAVVGDFFDTTASAPLTGDVARLRSGPDVSVTADGEAFRIRGRIVGESTHEALEIRIGFVNDRGDAEFAVARFPAGPGAPRVIDKTVPLRNCSDGCVPYTVSVEGFFSLFHETSRRPHIQLTTFDFGGLDLSKQQWVDPEAAEDPGRQPPLAIRGGIVPGEEAVSVFAPRFGAVTVVPVEAIAALPVVATDSVRWDKGEDRTVATTAGRDRPAKVVGRIAALPLVEADGVVADLPGALAAAGSTIPAASPLVLARADTPEDLLAALTRAGGDDPVTLDQAKVATVAESNARQSRLYLIVGGCCLLVALSCMGSAGAAQRDARRREVAALRLVGVRADDMLRSGRLERLVLSCVAVATGVVGGLVASRLVLEGLPLVTPAPYTLPLQIDTNWTVIAFVAVVAAVVVLAVGGSVTAGVIRSSRPAMLREEAQL